MKTTKNILKVKQRDLFSYKSNPAQSYTVKTDPTSSMATVTVTSTRSITTIMI